MSHLKAFRDLHKSGIFVMPNPWDRGSALALEELGFGALATTSAGLARSLGKDDQQVTRSELLRHVAELTEVLSVPLSVDAERLFPNEPGGVEECVRLLAAAGAVGCSIEDYDPATGAIDPIERASAAVADAAAACSREGMLLTARAENHIYRSAPLADTIDRLVAYRAAGAEVLYAPGLTDIDDIGRLVSALGGSPVNVLAYPVGPSVSELESVGVRRVSTGSALHNACRRTLEEGARELLESGTSAYSLG